MRRDVEAVSILAKNPAHHCRNSAGDYPVHIAARLRDATHHHALTNIMHHIVMGDGDACNRVNASGKTALEIAINPFIDEWFPGAAHPDVIMMLATPEAMKRQVPRADPMYGGMTPVHMAASNDSHKALAALLSLDPEAVLWKDAYDRTPLFVAVQHGSVNCAYTLLRDRRAVLTNDLFGRSPLAMAVEQASDAFFDIEGDVIACNIGHTLMDPTPAARTHIMASILKILSLLVDATADAARYGLCDVPSFKLEYPYTPPLCIAAFMGHMKLFRSIMALTPSALECRSEVGKHAIHYACYGNQAEMVKAILEYDPEAWSLAEPDFQHMPVHIAAEMGSVDVLRALHQHRPNVLEARNNIDMNPLMMAIERSHVEAATFILEHAPHTARAVDDVGENAAWYAVRYGAGEERIQMLGMLMSVMSPTDVWDLNHYGLSIMHIVVNDALTDVMDYLYRHDAQRCVESLAQKDNARLTPLDMLARNLVASPGAIRDILMKIWSICPAFVTNSTAVHFAAEVGNVAFLEAVLGVDNDAWCRADEDGCPFPLLTALEFKHYRAAETIVSSPVPEPDIYVRILRSHKPHKPPHKPHKPHQECNLHRLIVRVIEANPTRLTWVWDYVPLECDNLLSAIPAIVKRAPQELRKLISKMTPKDRSSVATALWAMRHVVTTNQQCGSQAPVGLPMEMCEKVLSFVYS